MKQCHSRTDQINVMTCDDYTYSPAHPPSHPLQTACVSSWSNFQHQVQQKKNTRPLTVAA